MPPNVLAIETALDSCSVAIVVDGAKPIAREHHGRRVHAEQLVPMIKSLLDEVSLPAAKLGAVAVSSGPGSYTGLRIGVSTAKGICFPHGIALVSVPTLYALATRAAWTETHVDRALGRDPSRGPSPTLVAIAMRARADELYWAVYELVTPGERTLTSVVATSVVAAGEAAAAVTYLINGNATVILAGTATDRLREMLSQREEVANGAGNLIMSDARSPLAEAVASIGVEKLKKGETEDLSSFEPAYLKEFVAVRSKGSIFDQLQF